ncbi:protein BANP-like [Lampetra fluviatilis]
MGQRTRRSTFHSSPSQVPFGKSSAGFCRRTGSASAIAATAAATGSGTFTKTGALARHSAGEDYPHGTWLGDEWNVELRVRCPIAPGDLLHVTAACRTPEKMALALLDHLFHREVQAASNLSGHGHHGKKQLDRLMVYGIRCHLFYKFGITECDWCCIKLNIDAKCCTAWRRKQLGQSLAVKGRRGTRGTDAAGAAVVGAHGGDRRGNFHPSVTLISEGEALGSNGNIFSSVE